MPLSPRLSLYIGRQFLGVLLATLVIIMALILLFDTIELLRRSASKPDATLGVVLQAALLKLPNMVHKVLPFIVMIGAMFTFWRLTRHHELTVMRACGISIWQVLAPVVLVVLALGVFNVTVFNPFAAATYSRYERLENAELTAGSGPMSLTGGGLWLREDHRGGRAVIHAGDVWQEDMQLQLRHASIFLLNGDNRFRKRIEAKRGRLHDGTIRLQGVTEYAPGTPAQKRDSMRLSTSLTLSRIQENYASPATVSFWDLPGFIRFFEEAGFSAHRHRLHLQRLIASPFLLCAMTVVGAIFFVGLSARRGGLLWRTVGGITAGFVVYFFSQIVEALGLSATLPVWLAAWSTPAVTAMLAAATLFHLEDG